MQPDATFTSTSTSTSTERAPATPLDELAATLNEAQRLADLLEAIHLNSTDPDDLANWTQIHLVTVALVTALFAVYDYARALERLVIGGSLPR